MPSICRSQAGGRAPRTPRNNCGDRKNCGDKKRNAEGDTMSNFIDVSEIIKISWDDSFAEESFWHISHKANLHKIGIKKGQKTLNNYYSSKSDAVFIGSMEYCLAEYPKYTKNGIYHLYKIDNWYMSGKKGKWVGAPQHNNTKKTDQFKCYDDILPNRNDDDPNIEYYGQYKIKDGIAFPWKNGWEAKDIEKKIIKQFQLNNKKQNPEEYVKVLVEISMTDKKALAQNGGKRFYTKRLKRKNLQPRDRWEQKRVDDSKKRKLVKLLQKNES